MKHSILFFAGLMALAVSGCTKPKEITPLQRKQGLSYASEAQFAMSVRDYPRAEGLFTQATATCPDTPDFWLGLGSARRHQDNRGGAKDTYEKALKASQAMYKKNTQDPQPLLQQVYLLALLGRVDDARATLEKARTTYPENRTVRAFVDGKQLDRLLAEPAFKEMAP